MSRQDLRCIALTVLLFSDSTSVVPIQMGMGKCLFSCLSAPSLPFHVVLLSPFFYTNAPSCSSLPLVPHGSFSSPPPISYTCVLLWLCPSLALPLCPCDSHGPAVPSAPSHFLLLPLPSLTLLLSLQKETPLSIFPPL